MDDENFDAVIACDERLIRNLIEQEDPAWTTNHEAVAKELIKSGVPAALARELVREAEGTMYKELLYNARELYRKHQRRHKAPAAVAEDPDWTADHEKALKELRRHDVPEWQAVMLVNAAKGTTVDELVADALRLKKEHYPEHKCERCNRPDAHWDQATEQYLCQRCQQAVHRELQRQAEEEELHQHRMHQMMHQRRRAPEEQELHWHRMRQMRRQQRQEEEGW